jgi:predicted anti-sigma-YlaC factor YlaD
MDCKKIHELLPDLAAGMEASTPEIEKHIASCAACSAQFRDFQKTMAVLDEWQVSEPSPYFDTRLQARLREEMERPPARWFERLSPSQWMRGILMRPVWSMSVAAVLFTAAIVAGNRSYITQADTIATNPPALGLPAQPGTAVADLQALEKNDELYADFDVLDELQVQDDVTANP